MNQLFSKKSQEKMIISVFYIFFNKLVMNIFERIYSTVTDLAKFLG